MFEGAGEKSQRLGMHYRQVAEQLGCAFLDTSTVIVSSEVDGIHFDYIRYPGPDHCFCAPCRERFERSSIMPETAALAPSIRSGPMPVVTS